MRRIAICIACTGFLAGLLVMVAAPGRNSSSVVPTVRAQGNDPDAICSDATLKGSYAAQRNGHTLKGEVTAVGLVKFDGHGNSVIHDTISNNGVFSTVGKLGGYQVNPDCTGTLTDPSGKIVVGALVIDHNGSEILALSLTPGNNVAVHFERVVDPPGNAPAGTTSRP